MNVHTGEYAGPGKIQNCVFCVVVVVLLLLVIVDFVVISSNSDNDNIVIVIFGFLDIIITCIVGCAELSH